MPRPAPAEYGWLRRFIWIFTGPRDVCPSCKGDRYAKPPEIPPRLLEQVAESMRAERRATLHAIEEEAAARERGRLRGARDEADG